jgi:hypothetical protein
MVHVQTPRSLITVSKYLLWSSSQPHGIPHNEVIVSQSECTTHISLDEYDTFSALPLGDKIQYKNALAELSMTPLDFAKVETHLSLQSHVARYFGVLLIVTLLPVDEPIDRIFKLKAAEEHEINGVPMYPTVADKVERAKLPERAILCQVDKYIYESFAAFVRGEDRVCDAV